MGDFDLGVGGNLVIDLEAMAGVVGVEGLFTACMILGDGVEAPDRIYVLGIILWSTWSFGCGDGDR